MIDTSEPNKVTRWKLVVFLPLSVAGETGVEEEQEDQAEADQIFPGHFQSWPHHSDALELTKKNI